MTTSPASSLNATLGMGQRRGQFLFCRRYFYPIFLPSFETIRWSWRSVSDVFTRSGRMSALVLSWVQVRSQKLIHGDLETWAADPNLSQQVSTQSHEVVQHRGRARHLTTKIPASLECLLKAWDDARGPTRAFRTYRASPVILAKRWRPVLAPNHIVPELPAWPDWCDKPSQPLSQSMWVLKFYNSHDAHCRAPELLRARHPEFLSPPSRVASLSPLRKDSEEQTCFLQSHSWSPCFDARVAMTTTGKQMLQYVFGNFWSLGTIGFPFVVPCTGIRTSRGRGIIPVPESEPSFNEAPLPKSLATLTGEAVYDTG